MWDSQDPDDGSYMMSYRCKIYPVTKSFDNYDLPSDIEMSSRALERFVRQLVRYPMLSWPEVENYKG